MYIIHLKVSRLPFALSAGIVSPARRLPNSRHIGLCTYQCAAVKLHSLSKWSGVAVIAPDLFGSPQLKMDRLRTILRQVSRRSLSSPQENVGIFVYLYL